MQIRKKARSEAGFTWWDCAVLVLTVALGIYLLSMLPKPVKKGCGRMSCVNQVKYVGLAFLLYSIDHGDAFPWNIPEAQGGTKELTNGYPIYRHFLAISNELGSPIVLHCSFDRNRRRTTDWGTFRDNNLSYFVGLTATEAKPNTLLAGDRNVTTNGVLPLGKRRLVISPGQQVVWSPDIHIRKGNIGFWDGSVQETTSIELQAALAKSEVQPTVLLIP